MRILICGSRDASPAMLEYARRCVERAKEKGHELIVGDARGIDTEVVSEAIKLGVPVRIYGIAPQPRCLYTINNLVKNQTAEHPRYKRCAGNYLDRDCRMVEDAELVVAIWNQKSRGTKFTYDYAVKLNKKAHLIKF